MEVSFEAEEGGTIEAKACPAADYLPFEAIASRFNAKSTSNPLFVRQNSMG